MEKIDINYISLFSQLSHLHACQCQLDQRNYKNISELKFRIFQTSKILSKAQNSMIARKLYYYSSLALKQQILGHASNYMLIQTKFLLQKQNKIRMFIKQSKSPNITYINLYSIINSFFNSFCGGTPLVMLIQLITNDQLKIGMITGAVGMAMMFGGVAYAPFIDHVNHVKFIKLTILPYFICSLICIICIHLENQQAITISQIFLGLLQCIQWPTISTIVSNSVSMEDRVMVNSNLSIVKRLGQSAGPLISAIFYQSFGDKWEIWLCQIIVQIGFVMSALTTLILLNLNPTEVNKKDEKENEKMKEKMGSSFCNPVLAILLIHNLVIMLASGMSIRQIPIFMSTQVGLSPFFVQLCEFFTIITGIFFIQMAQQLAKKIGNLSAMIIFDQTGVFFFFLLIWFQETFNESSQMEQLVFQIIVSAMQCLRSASMNSTQALDRTITMDHCPKEHRGKMNSIEVFFGATWCGSAVFGGELIELMSLMYNFITTACIQFGAVSLNLLLFRYAYKDKNDTKEELIHDNDNEKNKDKANDMRQEQVDFDAKKASSKFGVLKMDERKVDTSSNTKKINV